MTRSPTKSVGTYLSVKILPFYTKVSVNDVEAHQQSPHHRSLLLHHQRSGVIKLTKEESDTKGIGKITYLKTVEEFAVSREMSIRSRIKPA